MCLYISMELCKWLTVQETQILGVIDTCIYMYVQFNSVQHLSQIIISVALAIAQVVEH